MSGPPFSCPRVRCVSSVIHFLKSPLFTHISSFIERFRVNTLDNGWSVQKGDQHNHTPALQQPEMERKQWNSHVVCMSMCLCVVHVCVSLHLRL
jgi:hypothetical protein